MANLDTTINVKADSSGVSTGLEPGKRALKDFGQNADAAGKALSGVGAGGDAASKKVESATRNMAGQIQRLTAEFEGGEKGSRKFYESLAKQRGVDVNSLKPYLDQLDAAKTKSLAAAGATDGFSAAIGKVGPMVAAAFSGAAVLGFTAKLVSVQREFDVLNSSLITVTGSSANAAREMQWIKDFAKETPFGLAQATQGFVKMKALGLDPTRASLTSFGNTASAMGKDLNQMIEAVADASTGEFERLKEFGIKAKKEGENVSLTFQGVTTTIGNSASEITGYLEKLGNVEFAGAMAERAKTLDGAISELGDTWDELFRTINTNNTGSVIYDSITLATSAIGDATTIINAMTGAASANAKETGAMAAIQSGIATVFETVAVVGANLKFVLVGIGNEIGGLAAQVGQAAQFNFAGVRAIREQMMADAKAARAEIDATTARILGARDAAKELASYGVRNAGAASDPRSSDVMADALALNAKRAKEAADRAAEAAAKGAKKALADANKELVDQAKLLAELSGLTGSFSEDWDRLGTIYKKGGLSLEGLTKAQAELLAKQPFMKAKHDAEVKASKIMQDEYAQEVASIKELSAAQVANDAARSSGIQAVTAYADSIKEQNEYSQIELSLMGSSATAREIALGQYKVELDLKKQIEAIDSNPGFDEEQRITQRARARAAAAQSMAGVEAKAYTAEWKKTSDSINSTLTDALMRGFESGKDFAKNLRDTIVNMFKTMVLRPIISAVMSPISGALTGALGLSGAANAAGGVSAASTAMSGLSLAMSSFGGSFMSGLSTTFASGFSTLGLAVEGGLASIATGTATGISAGIGQALGAVAGPLAIGAGVLAALGAFRSTKQTGTGISGTLGDDASLTGFDEMRKSGYLFGGPKYWDEIKALDPLMAKALKTDFTNIKAAATGAADALGLASTEVAGFNKAFRIEFTGDKAKDEALYAELMAGTADDLAKTILGSYKEAITTVTEEIASGAFWDSGESLTSTVTRQVKTSSYTPSEFANEGETASQTLTRLAVSLSAVNASFDQLGYSLIDVGLKGADTASKLIDAFGGAEAMAATMGSYYQGFYTETERTAKLTEQTSAAFAALGKTMPVLDEGARKAYRSMVEEAAGKDLTVDANRNAYASILSLNGAMNELAPAFADVTTAADNVSASTGNAAENLRTLAGLQSEYDNLTMTQAQQRNAQWLSLNEQDPTGGLSGLQIKIWDIKDAADATALSAAQAANALADFNSKRQSLQAEYDDLTLTQAQKRNAEWLSLNAQDPSGALSGLQIAVWDAGDAAARAAKEFSDTASAADAASASVKNLAATNKTLQDQLDVLTGAQTDRSIALRDATDASTVALLGQIYAQQDLKTAADAAAAADSAATKKVADERAGLQNQLNALTDTSAQALTRQREALDASNRALFDQVTAADAAKTAAAQAAQAVEAMAQRVKGTFESLASNKLGLQSQLLTAQGKPADALAATRSNELAAFTAGLSAIDAAAITTAYAYNAALEDQIKALDEATAASDALKANQAALASTNKGYQDQLDVLTGTQTDRGIALRDATDASTIALMEQVYAQQDLKTSAEEAAATSQKIADERSGLQDQLNALTDTSAEALTRQRDALDASNRSLFDQVTAADAAKTAAAEAATAAEEMASRIKSAFESLADNKTSLQSQLLSAQGDPAGALAATRAAELSRLVKDLSSADAASITVAYAYNTAIEDQIKVLTDATAALDSLTATNKNWQDQLDVLTGAQTERSIALRDTTDATTVALMEQVFAQQDLKTASEEAAAAVKAIADERKGLQDQYDDLSMTSAQLLSKQRDALDESNRALFDSINLLKSDKEARDAALASSKEASSDAFAGVQRAVAAQRKIVEAARAAASESVNEIKSVFDTLKSSVKELYGTVGSTAKMQADQGRAFVKDALSTALKSGYLPDSEALSDALSAIKSDASVYASQFEVDFAALTLAGDLSQLEKISGGQLTNAERALKAAEDQLTALDGVLDTAQKQLDAANGINTSVLSVEAAVSALAVALGVQSSASGSDGASGSGWAGASESQITAGYAQMYSGIDLGTAKADQERVSTLYNQLNSFDKLGGEAWRAAVAVGGDGAKAREAAMSAAIEAAGLPSDILATQHDALFGSGKGDPNAHLADLARIVGAGEDYYKYVNSKFPQYEIGTNYVPNDGPAYLHEGEAVIPKAYNPAAGGQSNSRTDALIEGLTKEVQRLQSIVADGNANTRRTADAVNGNPEMPMLVETV